MRLALTVVSPATRRWADVLLDADPAMLVAELGAELGRLAYGTAPAGGGGAHAPQTVSGAGGRRPAARCCGFPGRGRRDRWPRRAPRATSRCRGSRPRQHHLFRSTWTSSRSRRSSRWPARRSGTGRWSAWATRLAACGSSRPAWSRSAWPAVRPPAGCTGSAWARPTSAAGRRASIQIGDRTMPPLALRIRVQPDGSGQVAPYQGVAATLDREPLTETTPWRPGQLIAVGSTLLDIAPYEAPDAALHPSQDGTGIDFNRPPRLLPPAAGPGSRCRPRRASRNGGRCPC